MTPLRGRFRHALARHAVPALLALTFVLPLLLMVAGSLRPTGLPPPAGLDLLPDDPTMAAYGRLDDFLPLSTYLRNSLLVAAVAVPLTVLVASLAGYGLRVLPEPWARRAIIAIIVVMLIPVTAVWATRFEIFRLAGVVNTYVPLIAPALIAANPFYVLIYGWAFSRLPDEQLDAARLDGASEAVLWWRVAMPQVRAATLAVLVLAFAFHWSNFIDPLLYLNSLDRFTYPLGLRFLQQLNPTEWPLLMAGSVIFAVPVLLVLLFAQRVLFEDPRRVVETTGGSR